MLKCQPEKMKLKARHLSLMLHHYRVFGGKKLKGKLFCNKVDGIGFNDMPLADQRRTST
jgi:hypothetical protein